MKNRGFTLAELLGVIVIISVLVIILMPPIVNQFKKMQGNVSGVALEILSNATYLFMDGNKSTYPLVPTTYCITLQQLINDGKLEEPIIDTSNGATIPNDRIMKVIVNSGADIDYSLVVTCP